MERESRRLEGDIDSLTRKAKAEEGRLYDGSVANPKELEAIQHEVASLRGRRSRLEDNLLELMEQKEGLDARASAAQAEVQEFRDRLTEIMGESATELALEDSIVRGAARPIVNVTPSIRGRNQPAPAGRMARRAIREPSRTGSRLQTSGVSTIQFTPRAPRVATCCAPPERCLRRVGHRQLPG